MITNDTTITAEQALADIIEKKIKPDVYAVLHLRRSVGGVRGTQEIYNDVAAKLMAKLSKEFCSKWEWRRRLRGQRLIPNVAALELAETRPHLNLLMRKPASCDFVRFDELLRKAWMDSPWASRGRRAYYCDAREPGSLVSSYILKEGTKALLERSMSFPA